ncbi:unnamed protein product [Cuscuta epithymum]|uniref:Uncharacterized protein n=1 Tax=Cuscuta epithymum TaxID=186058 RepID=A0AAV0DC30_9ASTE|nr:unnamed protein product [Cuscuta epithymum]
MSPGDVSGHGTHTSSTAAGRPVDGANLSGLAGGTARGAVPSARVAMYKVCWATVGCSDQDILAGFDAAMADGVDIISISIAVVSETYETNTLAIGSFHAMRRGILTVASAGNDGPSYNTLYNHAPWLLTVGASGTDRQFRSDVVLGSGRGGSTISGIGVNTYELQHNKSYPIATGVAVSNSSENDYNAMFCGNGSMAPAKVKGKIIYCKYGAELDADSVVKGLGGIGTVIESDNLPDTALVFMAPATIVNSTNGQFITHFINSTRSPSALIFKSKEVKVKAPFVASFSSRGPNPQVKRILKPDIVAPGIDILASYTPLQSITRRKGDTQYSQFNLFSGTSMSCPHVAGVAAYVKSFHPEWSPAAIKSAILTTATPMSSTVDREAEFAYGAGQVNPTRARNPGLVYDMENATMSYAKFLCREGSRNSSALSKIIGGSVDCSKLLRVSDANENGEDIINYPTMQLALGTGNKNPITVGVFKRTVTNVGMGRSYNATIFGAPKGVEISVKPMSLSFNSVGQKLNFTVVVKVSSISSSVPLVSASLTWRSNGYVVRSPIVIYNSSQYFF